MADATAYLNGEDLAYPLTKMNFLVTLGSDGNSGTGKSQAAFSEVTGMEATVDVIEFRQGNAHSLSPVKLPGLVKHGNVTLKAGYVSDTNFKEWIIECVDEKRSKVIPRKEVQIELIDLNDGYGSNTSVITSTTTGGKIWKLKNAWVTKYTGPDLNAMQSEIAIESVELAYEELEIPN